MMPCPSTLDQQHEASWFSSRRAAAKVSEVGTGRLLKLKGRVNRTIVPKLTSPGFVLSLNVHVWMQAWRVRDGKASVRSRRPSYGAAGGTSCGHEV